MMIRHFGENEGIRPKLAGKYGKLKIHEKWTSQTLGNLLGSAAYIGFHEVNKSNRAKDQSRLKPHQQYKLVKATWPAIVDKAEFDAAQELLDEAKKLERVRLKGAEERFYVLSGILRCSECGSPLIGQAAHGTSQVHRYYGHTKAHSNTACQYHRVPAQELEEAVLEYIWSATKDAGYLEKIEQNIRELRNVKSINVAREKRMMKEQLQNVQVRIDNLLLMQGQASSQEALKLVMKTFESLSKEKTDLENRLIRMSSGAEQEEAIKESVQIIKENLREFERAYRKAKGSMKKRLLRKLLKQVVLSPEGLHIFMQLADGAEIPNHQIKLIRFEGLKDEKNPQYALSRKASGNDSNLQVINSVIGKLGDPRTLISKHQQPLESIEFVIPEKQDFSKEFVEKYENGFSVAEIAAEYECSKHKVLVALKRHRVNMRPKLAFKTTDSRRYKGKSASKPYYGFCYFEGKLTKHPIEFPVLQSIHRQWQQGKSAHYINLDLNKRRIKSREGREWSWAAIQNILKRFEEKKIVLHKGGRYELG